MNLQAGTKSISLDHPLVMGVLNVTPDSFSDGGQFLQQDQAIAHAESMIAEGAGIIDVGGESTRPGAEQVGLQEELDRVLPVIERIVARFDIHVSIDTSKPEVMVAAVGAGAAIINDIYSLQLDGALDAAASTNAAICLMHMQGTPATMQKNPHYKDIGREVADFLRSRVDACESVGIARNRIVIDPGFGFGKNDRHNLELLAKLDQLTDLGLPMLVGLSRKRTLGNLIGRSAQELTAAGVAAAVVAVAKGAKIVRTHDVAETVDALELTEAVRLAGLDK